ncbi:hypothetical protein BX666DRAFT_1860936 [Dichotomocladium elegans]|nr:hypothetical protein BX666DRAFT_1860936 [Dichotomocladium elegans]
MGFMEKLKMQYDLRKINKYTKRRLSQSQFASHDRQYYDTVYRDGVYLESAPDISPRRSSSTRWSALLKRNGSNSNSLAASQYKTSETYTLGVSR